MSESKKLDDLNKISKLLPECCQSFLYETGTAMAVTTRLAYAHELLQFFSYLIKYDIRFANIDLHSFSYEHLKMISSQDISKYLTYMQDNNCKERTLARKRASISSYFAFLVNNRIIDLNPVLASSKVKIHTSDTVLHINISEQVKLLNSIDSGNDLDENKKKYHERYRIRDYAILLLLLDTGIRVSELVSININDIDFSDCSIIILRKGGNIQTIYFSNETKNTLLDYLDFRKEKNIVLADTDPLFVTLKNTRIGIRAIENLVKKYTTTALPGIGNKLSPHKMRASFAMAFYEEEKDILALQRKLGHKNLAATNIYAKATDKQMKETRSILEEKRKQQ